MALPREGEHGHPALPPDQRPRRLADQRAPEVRFVALTQQGAAEVRVEQQQGVCLQRLLVQGREALPALLAAARLPQASGVLVTGHGAEPRHVGEQRPQLGQRGVGLTNVPVAPLGLVDAILDESEQCPGERGALVAADVVGGAPQLGLPARLVPGEGAAALPALQQGVGRGEVVQEAVAPLPAAAGPLAGVLAQDRAGVQGEVLGQRVVGVLGEDVEALGVEVLPARRQQHVQAELALVAAVERLGEDLRRLIAVARPEVGREQGERVLEGHPIEGFVLELARLLDVLGGAVRQREHDELLRARLQVRGGGGRQLRLADGHFLALVVEQPGRAVLGEDQAGEDLLRRHLDHLLLREPALFGEDELNHPIRDRFTLFVLHALGAVRDDGDGPLPGEAQVGPAGEVLGPRQGPRDEAGEVEAVEAADRAAGADVEVGVEVQQRLAVADDALADAGRQGSFVAEPAGAVEGDGEAVMGPRASPRS